MILDYMKRRKTAKDAAQLLRNAPIQWTTGYWFVDLETNQSIDSDASMGRIRTWLRERGVGARNKPCRTGVCAEGALLYALALDPTIPDDEVASDLLRQYQRDAGRAAMKKGWWEDEGGDLDGFSIPDLNDDYLGAEGYGKENVVEWLDLIGDTAEERGTE